jgi:hypothetical protein
VSIVQSGDDGMSLRALSAYLAFCDKIVYCCYLSVPHFNMSAMQDQQCAVRDVCIGLQNAEVIHIASHREGRGFHLKRRNRVADRNPSKHGLRAEGAEQLEHAVRRAICGCGLEAPIL